MRLKITNTYQNDDRTSQIVSWGHWFTLFNIIITMILGSRYLMISDWPSTLLGRLYAVINTLGHFSFLCFAGYVIVLFPLSLLLRSERWIRLLAVLLATIGMTLLLIDIDVYRHFRMHLNLTIWDILSSNQDNLLSRQWQRLFIFVPLIFVLETLAAAWLWKKLRSLRKRRRYAWPVAMVLIGCFVLSHLTHIWADANFYRPITMQRTSLPLSYPMTARHLLKQFGFMDDKQSNAGNPFAAAIEYPLAKIQYRQDAETYNILMIVIDAVEADSVAQSLPSLQQFAEQNLNFTQHYSGGNSAELGEFTLFYGLDANYYNSILATHKSSVLLNTLAQRNYNLGLFATDNFAASLYRYALLSDFSLPQQLSQQNNAQTVSYWQKWLQQRQAQNGANWFSLLNLQLDNTKSSTLTQHQYQRQTARLDQQLAQIFATLQQQSLLDNTIVVITAGQGLQRNGQSLNAISSQQPFARQLLHVPLVIHWPGKSAQVITQPTTHVDLMRTMMQHALAVTTAATQYSQGEDLFALPAARQWLISGNADHLVALYADKTVAIDQRGHYRSYGLDGQQLSNDKLNLATFLQLITTNRRFMVKD